MADVPALWDSSSRKEAMDLLELLWAQLDAPSRDRLSETIVAGPPPRQLEHIDEEERERSRDRRIFDRIVILERCEAPPLTAALRDEMARLRGTYPEWTAAEGERARFGTWMESRWGPDTNYDVEALQALNDEALLATLVGDDDKREGLLDAWRQLAIADSARALALLEMLGRREEKGRSDVWQAGLWGLRDSASRGSTMDRVVALLAEMPDDLFSQAEFSDAAADILEGTSRGEQAAPAFWTLFDRTLAAESRREAGETNDQEADNNQTTDWVSLAINRAMGRLAGAFFNALFARRPRVGDGIPADLSGRFEALVAPDRLSHRPARVIAASRISYLYAIDQALTERLLLPGFRWVDEEEAIALWQGYAWQARIDPQLWAALKTSFLPLFNAARLARLGAYRRNIAQLLMLVGVEFGADELPRDETRNAIRAMPEDMRSEAVGWVASYLEQQDIGEAGVDAVSEPDVLWRDRVAPWLKRVWPPEPAMRSSSISEQFALAAIATDDVFPDAVRTIRNYLVPSNAFHVLYSLEESTHPDVHPQATLELIEAVVAAEAPRFGDEHLSNIVQRIAATPDVADSHIFRRWREVVDRNNN